MPCVYVSIGTNIDRERNVRYAVKALRKQFGTLAISPVYESAPVGFEGDDFYNLVVGLDTELSLRAVEQTLRQIENAHGRLRAGNKFGPRTLDIDVLLYGDVVDHTSTRDVPRREITQHAFVLKPLSKVAGDVKHPESDKTFDALWRELGPRMQAVRRVGISLD